MIMLPVRMIFFRAATDRIQPTVGPSIVSARVSGRILNPVLNISGRTTNSVGTPIPSIFSSSRRRLAALSSHWRSACIVVIVRVDIDAK